MNNNSQQLLLKPTTAQTYKILHDKPLGNGGFGSLYQCIDTSSGNDQLAVKLESCSTNNNDSNKTSLYLESKILKYLQGGIGIPKYISFITSKDFNFLVMELLGDNLEIIFSSYKKNLSLQTIINISIQMLNRIEFLHSKGFIHRDIKPENFVLGKRKHNKDIVYLIDYGLTKPFLNGKTKTHVPYVEGKNFLGTPRYASPNSHLGIALSRRDDVISFVYCVIYFLKGSLPWENLKKRKEDHRYMDIFNLKMGLISNNCYFKDDIDVNIMNLMKYVMNLKYEEMPDYKMIKCLLQKIKDIDIDKEEISKEG